MDEESMTYLKDKYPSDDGNFHRVGAGARSVFCMLHRYPKSAILLRNRYIRNGIWETKRYYGCSYLTNSMICTLIYTMS